jgi:hypothetical protein
MTHFNTLNGQNAYLSSCCVTTKSEGGNDIDRMRKEEALSTHSMPLKMSNCTDQNKAWSDVLSVEVGGVEST